VSSFASLGGDVFILKREEDLYVKSELSVQSLFRLRDAAYLAMRARYYISNSFLQNKTILYLDDSSLIK